MKFRLSTLPVSALLLFFACGVTMGQVSDTARKTDEELTSMNWKEIVDYYLQTIEIPNDPESKAYVDRLRTLLDHEGLMHIRRFGVYEGKLDDGKQIYYRPGELHVVVAQLEASTRNQETGTYLSGMERPTNGEPAIQAGSSVKQSTRT